MPAERQSHPDEPHTEISSSGRRRSVEPVLGYKLGRGRNAKVLYKRAEIFKWLEQQKVH